MSKPFLIKFFFNMTDYTVLPFKVYNSVPFRIFIKLRNPHHYLMPEHFQPHQKKPCALEPVILCSFLLSPSNCWSTQLRRALLKNRPSCLLILQECRLAVCGPLYSMYFKFVKKKILLCWNFVESTNQFGRFDIFTMCGVFFIKDML